jgi:hypothetical protein
MLPFFQFGYSVESAFFIFLLPGAFVLDGFSVHLAVLAELV